MINEGRQHVAMSPSIAHILGAFFKLHEKQGEISAETQYFGSKYSTILKIHAAFVNYI